MRKKAKFLTFVFVLFVIIPLFTLAFITWFVDPFKLWHESFYCKDGIYYKENMRYNAKYFIDNVEFDSLIFGSSMLENTSAKEAGDKLGGKFINISIRGSHFGERKIIMDYIFRHKDVKKIVSSLDTSIFSALHKFSQNHRDWDYLYDEDELNNIGIYLNNKFFTHIMKTFFKIITNDEIECIKADFDRPAAWEEETKKYLGGIENFIKSKKNAARINNAITILKSPKPELEVFDEKYMQKIKDRIQKDILSTIKSQPKTEFIFVIPPYSLLESAIYAQITPNVVELQKSLISYILEQKLPNLKIYAFSDMDFIDDIANYVDAEHYAEHINSLILDLISKNQGLLQTQNFEAYWQRYEKKARNFDLFKLLNN